MITKLRQHPYFTTVIEGAAFPIAIAIFKITTLFI